MLDMQNFILATQYNIYNRKGIFKVHLHLWCRRIYLTYCGRTPVWRSIIVNLIIHLVHDIKCRLQRSCQSSGICNRYCSKGQQQERLPVLVFHVSRRRHEVGSPPLDIATRHIYRATKALRKYRRWRFRWSRRQPRLCLAATHLRGPRIVSDDL